MAAWTPPKRTLLEVRAKPTELFTVNHIAWVSMLATPIAGAWLLRANFIKLGYPRAGWLWLAGISALVGAFCWILYFVQSMPGPVILLGYFLTMKTLAEVLQGPNIAAHREHGGSLAPLLKVATATVAWGAALLVFLLFIMWAFPPILGSGAGGR